MSVETGRVKVKICGIRDFAALDAAVAGGADFIGLVHVPRSPRHVDPDTAAALADRARGRARIVSLVVDADDALLERIAAAVRPDFIQCHGTESPERVRDVKRRTGAEVIRAFRVRESKDIEAARAFLGDIAFPLFDAWVEDGRSGGLTGGTGQRFDWSLLRHFSGPFMLAGGLSPENVAEAIAITGAPMVDVSSGVERARGEKDCERIAAFIAAAKGART